MASKYYQWTRGRVHYQRRGMGDPLVLLHDIYPGASHEEFARNLDALARRFTVYAVDLLGFGESDCPRLSYTADTYSDLVFDFLREEVRASAYVVASGMSAAYAARGVTWEDEWFRKLVFLCPQTRPTGLSGTRLVASLRRAFLALGGGQYEIATDDYALRQFLHERYFHPKEVTSDRVARLKELARRPGSAYPYASLLTQYLDGHLLDTLPKIDVPVLLIWGKQSRPTPVTRASDVLAAARHGMLEIIDQAGAWPHAEQSAKVNTLIADYLEGAPFHAGS